MKQMANWTIEELRLLEEMGINQSEVEKSRNSRKPRTEVELEELHNELERQKRKVTKELENVVRLIHRPEYQSHGWVFGELKRILGGTRWEKYCNMVNNCKTKESLERFLHNVWLGIQGFSESRLEIKTKGRLKFEEEQGLRLRH